MTSGPIGRNRNRDLVNRRKGFDVGKEQIKEMVIQHLKENVDGLDDQDIDTSKSMVDYGASSLDMVEIVSACLRELGIAIPRTRFTGLQNMDDLIELFLEEMGAHGGD